MNLKQITNKTGLHHKLVMAAMLVGASATAQDLSKRVIPIPQQPFAQPVPEFIGSPAIPKPIHARPVPQSPFMAPNGRSGVHLDAYQSIPTQPLDPSDTPPLLLLPSSLPNVALSRLTSRAVLSLCVWARGQ